MRRKILLAAVVGMLAVICASPFMAQDSRVAAIAGDKYLISAKAGGVNFISGAVSVLRKDGSSGYLLAGDELQIGDHVTTSTTGKAEILLNPGSYMRIDGNSSFEFVSTDLEDLKVSLKTGSAIFEVMAANEFRVSIKMPQSEIALTRAGVYRVDVMADGTAKLSVFKGKAYVGPGAKTEVEAGRTVALVKGGLSVSKFDKGEKDPFDMWSKDRAKELTKVNATLHRDDLHNTLLSSFNQSGWNMYGSFGLWVFDPAHRMWCFLPFGYGWSSPYGWDYGFDFWRCRMPWYVYSPPRYPPSTGGGSSGGATGPTISRIVTAGDRHPVPPFVKMQNSGGVSSSGRSGGISSSGRSIVDSGSGGGDASSGGRGRDNSTSVSTPRSDSGSSQKVSMPTSSPSVMSPSPVKRP